MTTARRTSAPICLAFALFGLMLVATTAVAEGPSQTPPELAELVRSAVANQVRVEQPPQFYTYRTRVQTPAGVHIVERVETSNGTVGRLLFLKGQPASDEQRKQWNESVNKFLADSALQARRLKGQQEEDERTRKMFAALNDAFLYELEEREAASGVVRLKLRPNPGYRPPSRELQPLSGMEGKLWIDPTAQRITRIEVNLFRNVEFGWGILGKLYKGGHIVMENARLADGNWRTVKVNLNLTGRILFKSLRVDQDETLNDFEPTPSGFTLANAVGLLRQLDPATCAAGKAAPPHLNCSAD